jgi:two-component system, chemotaxis family, protein-glutamate methylesterase/glutaminase
MKQISVLLVDDSALVRQLTSNLLTREPGIAVIGTASDPIAALRHLETLRPDVILLDVEMPNMNGLDFLQVLRANPNTSQIPVLMFSSLTTEGCETTFKALELGAIDFVTKPKVDLRRGFDSLIQDLVFKVRAAAHSKRPQPRAAAEDGREMRPRRGLLLNQEAAAAAVGQQQPHSLIAIGSSTGGTEALREIFSSLPGTLPPIVIVQHMHERFTQAFARRLNCLGPVKVSEAQEGEKLESGHAYLAPGGFHLKVHRVAGYLRAKIVSEEAVHGHRPSVDVLFHSCVKATASRTLAVILTGMGSDGASGMLALHNCGAHTIAQDEASCVVFGMPKEAIAAGGVSTIAPLDEIAGASERWSRAGEGTLRLPKRLDFHAWKLW